MEVSYLSRLNPTYTLASNANRDALHSPFDQRGRGQGCARSPLFTGAPGRHDGGCLIYAASCSDDASDAVTHGESAGQGAGNGTPKAWNLVADEDYWAFLPDRMSEGPPLKLTQELRTMSQSTPALVELNDACSRYVGTRPHPSEEIAQNMFLAMPPANAPASSVLQRVQSEPVRASPAHGGLPRRSPFDRVLHTIECTPRENPGIPAHCPASNTYITTLEQLCAYVQQCPPGEVLDLGGRTIGSRAHKPCGAAARSNAQRFMLRAWQFSLAGRGVDIRGGTIELPAGFLLAVHSDGVSLTDVNIKGLGNQAKWAERNAVLVEQDSGEVLLRRCNLDGVALVLRSPQQTTLENTVICGAHVGLEVPGTHAAGRVTALLRKCAIDRCASAMVVSGCASVVLRECSLLASHTGSGLLVDKGASAAALRCKFIRNRKHGVRAKGRSHIQLVDCHSISNRLRNLKASVLSTLSVTAGAAGAAERPHTAQAGLGPRTCTPKHRRTRSNTLYEAADMLPLASVTTAGSWQHDSEDEPTRHGTVHGR